MRATIRETKQPTAERLAWARGIIAGMQASEKDKRAMLRAAERGDPRMYFCLFAASKRVAS